MKLFKRSKQESVVTKDEERKVRDSLYNSLSRLYGFDEAVRLMKTIDKEQKKK